MWNKIKWVSVGLIISCLFYLNHQMDNQLKDRIIQLELESSHQRKDIIGLNSDIKVMGISITFYKNELKIANELFKKDFTEEIRHELGMMESKLKILKTSLESFEIEYRMKDELLRENLIGLQSVADTIQVDDKKGRQTLQEQIDQLRLEFNELIQKLEEHKRTQVIFQ